MPKQALKITAFQGGLNSNSDPRDVADSELTEATDVMVDELGKVRTMGGEVTGITAKTLIEYEPGYGLLQFSHDRLYGHLGEHLSNTGDFSSNWTESGAGWSIDATDASHARVNNTPSYLIQDEGDRAELGIPGIQYVFTYTIDSLSGSAATFQIVSGFAASNTALTLANGTHRKIFTSHVSCATSTFKIQVTATEDCTFNIDDLSLRIYDAAETGDDYLVLADTDSNANIHLYSKNEGVWSTNARIDLGSTADMKPTFYVADGALRISDGAFGAANINKWYGYVDRTLFSDTLSGGISPNAEIVYSEWHEAPQAIAAPTTVKWDVSNVDDGDLTSGAIGIKLSMDHEWDEILADDYTLVTYDYSGLAHDYPSNTVMKDDSDWRVAHPFHANTSDFRVVNLGQKLVTVVDTAKSGTTLQEITSESDTEVISGDIGGAGWVNGDIYRVYNGLTVDPASTDYYFNGNATIEIITTPDIGAPMMETQVFFALDEGNLWVPNSAICVPVFLAKDPTEWTWSFKVSVWNARCPAAADGIEAKDVGFTTGMRKGWNLCIMNYGDADSYLGIVVETVYGIGFSPMWDGDLTSGKMWIGNPWITNTAETGLPPAPYTLHASFLYDKSEQESALTEALGLNTVSGGHGFSIVGGSAILDFVFYLDNEEHNLNKRITGSRIYIQNIDPRTSDFKHSLLANISFVDGYKEPFSEHIKGYWKDCYTLGGSVTIEDIVVSSEPVFTYESLNGYPAEEGSSMPHYSTAVVANRMAYIGNVKTSDGEVMGDAMLKSTVNRFDSFPLVRLIEASVRDGDNIVKLEEYADRILQFKKNKMHLINISQEIEFMEDTFMYKGVSHPAATCKTDFGIAWVNKLGCYLYDGKQVHNLLEKQGRQIIKESEWNKFITDFSIIGYLPKKRQIIVKRDCRKIFTLTGSVDAAASTTVPGVNTLFLEEIIPGDILELQTETKRVVSVASNTSLIVNAAFSDLANDTIPECQPEGHIYLYDIVTQSWTRGSYTKLTGRKDQTNFVTDWNGDLIYSHTTDTGTFQKWDDSSATSVNYNMTTKDIDFGQPAQRKKIYKVYISFRGNGTHVQVHYGVDGAAPASTFFLTNADGTTTGSGAVAKCIAHDAGVDNWLKAELKPGGSINNVSSFRLKISGDGTNAVAADFEINDISIIYRLKNLK